MNEQWVNMADDALVGERGGEEAGDAGWDDVGGVVQHASGLKSVVLRGKVSMAYLGGMVVIRWWFGGDLVMLVLGCLLMVVMAGYFLVVWCVWNTFINLLVKWLSWVYWFIQISFVHPPIHSPIYPILTHLPTHSSHPSPHPHHINILTERIHQGPHVVGWVDLSDLNLRVNVALGQEVYVCCFHLVGGKVRERLSEK